MRRKIEINRYLNTSIKEVYTSFVISKTSLGVSETTLNSYKYQFRTISKYIDIEKPISDLSKRDVEKAIAEMRQSVKAYNTFATYVKFLRTFLHWCSAEGFCSIQVPNVQEKVTVKEPYSDEELQILLKKPNKACGFAEYRTWVIINFLMNSGCRAKTLRCIRVSDVLLEKQQVIFRHTKTGKIQVSPLCSQMVVILKEYLSIRQGDPEDYLFCDQYGEMLTENALRLAVQRYNRKRGIEKTSIHLFRHTFARKYLVDCGGDAFTLQHLLGHSTLVMTKRYCAIYNADIANNYDRLSPLSNITQKKERIKR